MRSEHIEIGGVYQARVGGQLRRVKVRYAIRGSLTLTGRRRSTRYGCITVDTRRLIWRTAAALRPLPGTREAVADEARRASREVRARLRAEANAARPRRAKPDWPWGASAPTIEPDGTLPDGRNRDTVRRAIGRLHVGDSAGRVMREAHGLPIYRWRSMPRTMRRAILRTALVEHQANRDLYRAAMLR